MKTYTVSQAFRLLEDYKITTQEESVHRCVEHMDISKDFHTYAWRLLQEHKRGYTTPQVPYLLEAAFFYGQRILLDTNYESIEEQVMFAVLKYIRHKNVFKR